MKYILVEIDTYSGEYHQHHKEMAKVEDHQDPSLVAHAIAKNMNDGFWDEDCKGFNTDYHLWNRVQLQDGKEYKEISEELFNTLLGYVPASPVCEDEELEEIKNEMEGE